MRTRALPLLFALLLPAAPAAAAPQPPPLSSLQGRAAAPLCPALRPACSPAVVPLQPMSSWASCRRCCRRTWSRACPLQWRGVWWRACWWRGLSSARLFCSGRGRCERRLHAAHAAAAGHRQRVARQSALPRRQGAARQPALHPVARLRGLHHRHARDHERGSGELGVARDSKRRTALEVFFVSGVRRGQTGRTPAWGQDSKNN
jgi:hypothetical protein